MDNEKAPLIVVSAINIFEGGTLSVLRECLLALNNDFTNEYRVEAFVHKITLFQEMAFQNITFHELPHSRKSWLNRVFYEYWYFRNVSTEKKPYLWISMHDTSPILNNTSKQCVYCHNPSVFHKVRLSILKYDKTHFLFTLFYKFLYQINIKANRYVIVQQDWIRNQFSEKFNLPISKILVSYANSTALQAPIVENLRKPNKTSTIFFYPAFPRTFKNFEVIINAAKILIERGLTDFQVNFTISGNENLYSQEILKMAQPIKNVTFLGKLSADRVQEEYSLSDVLIFPSTLETWGLPLSEFKVFDKPILAADLPYVYETLGSYDKVGFFRPDDCEALAEKMSLLISHNDDIALGKITRKTPNQPFTSSWHEMLQFILKS